MHDLLLLESFLDKPIAAGYSLRQIFEFWWIGLIILIVAVLALVGSYFLLAWLFGRMKFKEGDKEALDNYKKAPKEEKKELAKQSEKPVRNVIKWWGLAPWLIPVVCVCALILAAGSSFLPSAAFKNLLASVNTREPLIIDTEASRAAAAQAELNVVTIQEEGTVLLKNEDKALPIDIEQDNRINIFGSCAFGLYYGNGGSGSFQTDGRVNGTGQNKTNFPRVAKKLEVAMEEEGFEVNQNIFNMIKNYYKSKTVSAAEVDYDIQCGYNKYSYAEIVPSKDPTENEPPVSAYTTPLDELGGKTLLEDAREFSDTALFCISRRGSEDEDMSYSNLQLKKNEKDCIELLEQNFEKVIILLNVPTVIEAKFLEDPEIDAAIFMGHPGLTGAKAIAEILAGKVNPSGHLVDTWPYDVKSAPSYQNFGNDTTLSYTSGAANRAKFTNYWEGIYVGYRYYVTRAMVDDDYNYEDEVQYSFGHGLSYTTFDKSIAEFNVNEAEQKIEVVVEVKNTGDVAGKDVIQLYTHAPYYDGGIEKAYYSLTAFQKTNLLEPGEAKGYKLEFTYRDLASWDTKNGNYVLEHGDYEFSIRENVWDEAITADPERKNVQTINIANDIEFLTSYQTGKEYENIFQDVEYGGCEEPLEYLSRSDFAGTWKNTSDFNRASASSASHFPGGASNSTSSTSFTFQDNQIEGEVREQGINNGLDFMDFKGAEWDDPRWEDLLDQLSYSDMEKLVEYGGFQTADVSSINKPISKDYDGPASAFHSGTGHPSEVIIAASWSTDVARVMGESIGREGASRGLTGWYAPGINTHRSPFGGRNFEYYSEDPLIAGKMAGYTSQGTMKYGVYCYAKHFMCNDQENSRAGVFVWASEQALREIYARGFEIYVDLGGIGIMSSFNCIGSWWAGGSEALLTKLLREEWGFHGVVVTDYAGSDYMPPNIGLRAGNDMWLTPNSLSSNLKPSKVRSECPHDGAILLRRAAKNILYACANSNNVWTLEDYQAVGIDEINKATDKS